MLKSWRNRFAGCLTVIKWACRQLWVACEANWWLGQEITVICWMDTGQVNTIRGSRAFITLPFFILYLTSHYIISLFCVCFLNTFFKILWNDAWKRIMALNDVATIARDKLQDTNGRSEAQRLQPQTGTEQQMLGDQSGHLSFGVSL